MILITRPEREAISFKDKLNKLGHGSIIEPMLNINYNFGIRPLLLATLKLNPQALIITSKNAVTALAELTERRDFHLITIGPETSLAAKQLGFAHVVTTGTVTEKGANLLANFVVNHYNQDDGLILYLSADVIAGKVSQILTNYGYQLKRLIVYKAIAVTSLSDNLQNLIKTKQITSVIFCSKRTADIFIKLLTKSGLLEYSKDMAAYCLSTNIASSLKELTWQRIVFAANIDLMIEQIRETSDR